MSIRRVPGPEGASYSDAILVTGAGSWVYVSGQLPLDEDGKISAEGVGPQAERCFDHIERVLEHCGGSLANVVRITAYLTTLDDYAAYAGVRGRWFGSTLPASAAVEVAGLLGGALVEIDAVAFISA